MRQTTLNLPDLALIAITRAAAGIGLGLLLADSMPSAARRTLGWSLMLVGVFSTVPLGLNVLENTTTTEPAP